MLLHVGMNAKATSTLDVRPQRLYHSYGVVSVIKGREGEQTIIKQERRF